MLTGHQPAAGRTALTRQAFFYALVTGIVIFLPFILYDRGYFIYYGDFNVQQIPFYKLAHEAVRNGELFWNWHTDLGVNFIGSYSFYLLFSPFFWLTLPFPTAWVPALLGPLLVLKTACAALTAHLYLRRFLRDERFALIGAMLYAFSGWMDFNIFFNHFHDVAVFFPLLLLGLEKLITEDKKGLFAVAVLVNAGVNYWFFVGEAVFVVLYFLARTTDKSWRPSVRKFGFVAIEAVVGFLMASVMVVPSVMALMGNPRTGVEELLSGWNIWLYWHEQRQPAIVQSLFYPPELPARPNFLPGHGAKWASLSGWLPLFSMTGVLAYFFRRRDDWVKKILGLCLLFAMVPVLNAAFILFNDSYYARWFYMPILLMALATARSLEECGPEYGRDAAAEYARAVKWSAIIVAAFAVMSGLTPDYDDGGALVIGLADKPEFMWIYVAIAMTCLAASAFLVLKLRRSKRFQALALAGVLVVSAGFAIFYIANGKNNRDRSQWLIDHAINGRDKISLPDDGVAFSRIDIYDSTDNIGMYWRRPAIQAFHSIVPPSIMEFYPEVGVTRDVASRPEAELYALRPLLSVRWLFIEAENDEQEPMPYYYYFKTENDFHIYENANYIPMGFSYDAFVTPRLLEDVTKEKRSNMMLRAVVLDEETAARMGHLVQPLENDGYVGFTPEDMMRDVDQRRMYVASDFRVDRTGFTVATDFDKPRLLFLSVPWDRGWSARLDVGQSSGPGQEIAIEKANLGFMAIEVPAGHAEIRFEYEVPGLQLGGMLTVGGGLLLAGYLLLTRRKKDAPADLGAALTSGGRVTLGEGEFRAAYGDGEGRKAKLQEALNEAAVIYVSDELPEEDRTLAFSSDEAGHSGPEQIADINPAEKANTENEDPGGEAAAGKDDPTA